MTTFYPLKNPVRYPRCILPARALGAPILDAALERAGNYARQEGVGIWQQPSNRGRLEGMLTSKARAGGSVLFETDDDYSRWSEQYAHSSWMPALPPKEDILTPSVAVHRLAAELASGVIVSTPRLARVYRELNDNVHVCRNCVDPEDWPEPAEPDGIFRVVFTAAPRRFDLDLVRPALEWAAAQPGVEAWVVGIDGLGWPGVKEVGWTKNLQGYRNVLAQLSPQVGLRAIDRNEFSAGKSDLRILEYAMVGTLPIVTGWDPYEGWRGGPVMLVDPPDDWTAAVRWAVENQDEVAQRAADCREIVLMHRTLDAARSDWERAVESVTAVSV